MQNPNNPNEFTFVVIPDFSSDMFDFKYFGSLDTHVIVPTGTELGDLKGILIEDDQWEVSKRSGSELESCCEIGDGTLDFYNIRSLTSIFNNTPSFDRGAFIELFSITVVSSPGYGNFEMKAPTDPFVTAIADAYDEFWTDYFDVTFSDLVYDLSLQVAPALASYSLEALSGDNFDNVRFEVFPNPAKEKVIVKLPLSFRNIEVLIIDMMGRIVFKADKSIKDHTVVINTSDLGDGMYMVTISEQNSTLKKRIVIR